MPSCALSLQEAQWRDVVAQLVALGWEPSEDEDDEGRTVGRLSDGRTVVRLYGHEPIASEPTIEAMAEGMADLCRAAGLQLSQRTVPLAFGDMTWQTAVSVVLALASAAAQAVALDNVRAWGQRTGKTTAQRLRERWRTLLRRLDQTPRTADQRDPAWFTLPAGEHLPAYDLPGDLAGKLAPYIAAVEARQDADRARAADLADRVASLEVAADLAEANAADNARLTARWVVFGAVLASLSVLPQAFT